MHVVDKQVKLQTAFQCAEMEYSQVHKNVTMETRPDALKTVLRTLDILVQEISDRFLYVIKYAEIISLSVIKSVIMEIKQGVLKIADKIMDINANHNFLNLQIVLPFVVTAYSWVIKNVIIKIKQDVQITVRSIQDIVVLIKQGIYQIVLKYAGIILLL